MKKLFMIIVLPFLTTMIKIDNCPAQSFTSPNDSATVNLKVNYSQMVASDRLIIYYTNVAPASLYFGQSGVISKMAQKISDSTYVFKFQIPDKSKLPGVYIEIKKLKTKKNEPGDMLKDKNIDASHILLENYFVEAGDDLSINISKKPKFDSNKSPIYNFYYQFNGNGAKKCIIRHMIDSVRYSKDFYYDYSNIDSTFNKNNGEFKLATYLTTLVKPFQGKISDNAYNELIIHSLYSGRNIAYLLMRYSFRKRFKNASQHNWLQLAKDIEREDVSQWLKFNNVDLSTNRDFGEAELEKYHTIGYSRNKNWVPDSLINDLERIDNPLIRERLMILSAKIFSFYFMNYSTYLSRISKFIITNDGRAQLTNLALLKKGEPAYNFTLTDLRGKKVSLTDFKGKVVFVDFWYTGCENCSNYYHNVLSKIEEKFRSDKNYVFLSVSIDRNMKLWKNSVKTGVYTSEQVINLFTNGEGAANEVISLMNVASFPSPFIIDRHQNIFDMGLSLRDEQPLIRALQQASKN